MPADSALREQVAALLDWSDAHVNFDAAVANLPAALRGQAPAGLPYSPWQLLEHLRLAQHDILDFCRHAGYEQLTWPDDYWPRTAAPPSAAAWDESVQSFRADRSALQAMSRDPSLDLGARIPHGTGQTFLRELLLAADHAAYHVGELIVVRRLLGAWPAHS
ncbi:MAG TPA: DinB family protein [Gemmatimonadales bacterium]|nr:DinB family protein [Gemmatimonadales bacterium]